MLLRYTGEIQGFWQSGWCAGQNFRQPSSRLPAAAAPANHHTACTRSRRASFRGSRVECRYGLESDAALLARCALSSSAHRFRLRRQQAASRAQPAWPHADAGSLTAATYQSTLKESESCKRAIQRLDIQQYVDDSPLNDLRCRSPPPNGGID